MNTQVGKWGNSLAVRIPGTYAKELHLKDGMDLDVTRVGDGLLLRLRKAKHMLRIGEEYVIVCAYPVEVEEANVQRS